MKLRLTRLPSSAVIGIYGKNEDPTTGKTRRPFESLVAGTMPERMRALWPDAAVDYLRGSADIVVSDMFRSPESSLRISQIPGRSALPPGHSGHNYGFSIDVHEDAMRKRLGLKSKGELDEWMRQFNFINFWVDGKASHPKEDWHYNWLPSEWRDDDGGFTGKTTVGYLELAIQREYGASMVLSPTECQVALAKLKFYDGEADGQIGRLSKAAIAGFQRVWLPKNRTGELDAKTQRLLAYLTAEVEWHPLPAEMPVAA